jgi:type II secretory pathway pseudopilin PulG
MKNSKQYGFTLVELLVSISLIIILIGVMLPAINAIKNAGKKTMAEAEAAAIQSAIKSYHTRYGMYPVEQPDNLHYYSKSGDEVLDPEDGWALLENIADKNDDGVFLLELENYREGDDGEVLDPYGNPYMFLMDVHDSHSEYMADGTAQISNNSFEGRDNGVKYKVTDKTVPGGLKVIFFTGDDMGEID